MKKSWRKVPAAAVVPALAFAAAMMMFSFADAQTFTVQMEVGSRGGEVTALQTYLAADPTLYPEGLVTGYFGALTKAAVMRFQARHALPAVGRVGPLTLAKLNQVAAGAGVDLSAPIIWNVMVGTTTSTGATIQWTTSELARGRVYYGTSPLVLVDAASSATTFLVSGGSIVEESTFGTAHSLSLSGLATSTTYYYSIQSTDMAGNVMFRWPETFVTRP